MAFGKKFDKNKNKDKRKQQNPLFKRKKFCRFTAAGVEQIDYKDIDILKDFIQGKLQDHASTSDRNQGTLSTSGRHRHQTRPFPGPAAIHFPAFRLIADG